MISVCCANNAKDPIVVLPLLSDAIVTVLPSLLMFTKRTQVALSKLVAAPTVFGTTICVPFIRSLCGILFFYYYKFIYKTPITIMKNIPIPVLTFLAAQLGAAVWWGAQIDHKVKLVEENRRYIQEVVIPSYEISDNWNNPHYNNWLKAGGWKD